MSPWPAIIDRVLALTWRGLGWRANARAVALIAACASWLITLDRLSAEQVDVYLRNGDIIRGELIDHDRDHITVRRDIPTRSTAITVENTYYRGSYLQLQAVPRAEPEYDRRVLTTADTVHAHLELAQWCRDQDLPVQARAQALRAIKLAPHDPTTTSLLLELGYTYADGSWQELNAYLLRSGKVRYAGRIMTQGEAEVLRQKARDDERIAALIETIATTTRRRDGLRQVALITDRELSSLPEQINDVEDAIRQQRHAQDRFRHLMHAGAPGLGAQADGDEDDEREATSHVDIATARSQAQDAFHLLPAMLAHLAELHRETQLLQLTRASTKEQLDALTTALTSELSALDSLRSESVAMTVDAAAQP